MRWTEIIRTNDSMHEHVAQPSPHMKTLCAKNIKS